MTALRRVLGDDMIDWDLSPPEIEWDLHPPEIEWSLPEVERR